MKLLKPNEVITDKEKVFQITLKRSDDLAKELERKRKELDKLKIEGEILLEKQRISLEKEKEEYILQINILKSEVENLVLKRKDELVPLTEKWKELEIADERIRNKEIEIDKQKEIFDENLETLEEKLIQVAEREYNAKELSQKQAIAQEGIETQKLQIALQAKQINETIQSSAKELDTRRQAILRLETEVELRERVVKSKEEEIEKAKKELENKDRQIKDKYATLQRTLERLNITI